MASSPAFKNITMSNVFRTAGITAIPQTMFLAVSRTAPNANGGNVTEPVGGSYARVAITPTFRQAPQNGRVQNQDEIQFAESTSNWGVMTHWAVYGQATGGSALIWGVMRNMKENTPNFGDPEPRSVETGTILRVKPQDLYFALFDR